jgi:hypothetical protein
MELDCTKFLLTSRSVSEVAATRCAASARRPTEPSRLAARNNELTAQSGCARYAPRTSRPVTSTAVIMAVGCHDLREALTSPQSCTPPHTTHSAMSETRRVERCGGAVGAEVTATRVAWSGDIQRMQTLRIVTLGLA